MGDTELGQKLAELLNIGRSGILKVIIAKREEHSFLYGHARSDALTNAL